MQFVFAAHWQKVHDQKIIIQKHICTLEHLQTTMKLNPAMKQQLAQGSFSAGDEREGDKLDTSTPA